MCVPETILRIRIKKLLTISVKMIERQDWSGSPQKQKQYDDVFTPVPVLTVLYKITGIMMILQYLMFL